MVPPWLTEETDADFVRTRSPGSGVLVVVTVDVVVAVNVDVFTGVLVRVAVGETAGVGLDVGGQIKNGGFETHCASATLVFSPVVCSASAPSNNRAGITRNRTSKRKRIQPPLN